MAVPPEMSTEAITTTMVSPQAANNNEMNITVSQDHDETDEAEGQGAVSNQLGSNNNQLGSNNNQLGQGDQGAGNQKKDKNTRNNNTCGGGIEHLTLLSLLHDYGVLAFNIIAGSDTDEILDQMKA